MKRTTLTLLAAMSTTVVLAGCNEDNGGGGGSAQADSDPKAAVSQAFDKANEAKDQTATISLDSSSESLKKLTESSDFSTLSSDDRMAVEKVTELLPKSRITVSTHSRDQALSEEKDAKDLDTAMTLHIGEGKVEFRQVEGGMYMRADVDKIGQETGLFTADQLKMGLTGGSGAPADDPSMQFLTKALSGEWVGVSSEQVESELQKQGLTLEDLTKEATGGTEVSAQQQLKMQQDLKTFMDEHGEFTREGDVVHVAVPVEESWDDFAAIVNQNITDPSEKLPTLTEENKKAIKDDAKATIDVTLDGDQLKGLDLDFTQVKDFVDPASLDATEKKDYDEFVQQVGDGPLGLKIEYGQEGAPAKPDQFTEVPQELLDAGAASATGAGGAEMAG